MEFLLETLGKNDPEIILISGLQVGLGLLGDQGALNSPWEQPISAYFQSMGRHSEAWNQWSGISGSLEWRDSVGFGEVSRIPDFAYALLESLPEVQSFSNDYLVPCQMNSKKLQMC